MKNIKKGKEPISLAKYRNSLTGDYSDENVFDDYPDKSTLRKCLLEEQGYICCYCMQRIKNDNQIKIEHLKPQSKYSQYKLDYNNLFAACSGGEGNKPEKQHCDTRKGDRDLIINPTDCERDIIGYKSDGTIEYDPTIATDIEDILNLNNDILKKNRRQTIRAVINEFSKKYKRMTWLNSDIKKKLKEYENRNTEGQYKAYCQIVIFFLKKRLLKNIN